MGNSVNDQVDEDGVGKFLTATFTLGWQHSAIAMALKMVKRIRMILKKVESYKCLNLSMSSAWPKPSKR